MKKREILKLLEYRKNLIESNFGKKIIYRELVDELDNPLKGLYPDITDLQEEFAIIDKVFLNLREKRKLC